MFLCLSIGVLMFPQGCFVSYHFEFAKSLPFCRKIALKHGCLKNRSFRWQLLPASSMPTHINHLSLLHHDEQHLPATKRSKKKSTGWFTPPIADYWYYWPWDCFMLFCHRSKIKSLRENTKSEISQPHINTTPDITSIQTWKTKDI